MPRAYALLALLILPVATACNEAALKTNPDAGAPAGGLTPELAGRVLAKVGDRQITLGDYAATLERMDQFDRLRYQTKERRRELLNEMVDVELLATEAKRRGLDKTPQVEDAVRQVLRDALLSETRKTLPPPAEISADEVRGYYEANIDKFREPERRRVSAIVLEDKKVAEKVLKAAQKATPTEWGELFYKNSVTAPKVRDPQVSLELAGDLGFVGPADDPKGGSNKVPDAVRNAAFQIKDVGGVHDALVEADGKQYVVRLGSITRAHQRSLAEAERSIRVAILQQKMREQEAALEAELRKKFPVEINETALARTKLPSSLENPDATSTASPMPPGAGAGQDAGVAPQTADAGP